MGNLKFLFLLGFAIFSGEALADITVIGFDGPVPSYRDTGKYTPGKQLPDDHVFDIPRCNELIVWQGKQLLGLCGEYRGTLSAYRARRRCDFSQCYFHATGERQSGYERYFHTMCERGIICSELCRNVYKLVEDKTKLKLACP
jgi:hypothetical protein